MERDMPATTWKEQSWASGAASASVHGLEQTGELFMHWMLRVCFKRTSTCDRANEALFVWGNPYARWDMSENSKFSLLWGSWEPGQRDCPFWGKLQSPNHCGKSMRRKMWRGTLWNLFLYLPRIFWIFIASRLGHRKFLTWISAWYGFTEFWILAVTVLPGPDRI